ncbi:MAG: hypothetical protein BroJett025_04720 [Patescibacteria group bacterium]|nr:MAG: hypothetical protein BroJett025_04720 [Patescibacteria group bacterium]
MNKEKNSFVEVSEVKPDFRKKEPPFINLQIANPITYLKNWWKKVMSKEGVDFHFKIHPLTAIAITAVVATLGFGVGQFTISKQKPFIHYQPTVKQTPLPSISPLRETAFTGTLQFSKKTAKFYLLTSSAEAINITVLENVDLEKLIGRRIFATGEYNQETNTLFISEATNMELLPETVEEIPVEPEPTVLPTQEQNTTYESEIPMNYE